MLEEEHPVRDSRSAVGDADGIHPPTDAPASSFGGLVAWKMERKQPFPTASQQILTLLVQDSSRRRFSRALSRTLSCRHQAVFCGVLAKAFRTCVG